MNMWIISDTHFTHGAMLRFKREDGEPLRVFSSIEEMDETMVENWNRVVKPQDHCYHLGDVAMRKEHLKIIKRLNGKKRLIFGNHDIFEAKYYFEAGFQKVMGMRVLGGMLFTHVPIHPNSLGRFSVNVHGHIHDSLVIKRDQAILMDAEEWSVDKRYFNACVERNNYTPIALEEIKKFIKQ